MGFRYSGMSLPATRAGAMEPHEVLPSFFFDESATMHATVAGRRAPSWPGELLRRARTLWLVKMCGATLSIALFMAAYFWVLRHPFFAVTEMPPTALDRAIGFQPAALPVYLSLWLYISLAPGLLQTGRELAYYGGAAAVLGLTGLAIFMLWPTAVPVLQVDWSQYPSMAFLKDLDLAGNACPSLHVAFAVFTALWLERLLREVGAAPWLRAVNWLWCAGILYSTVATLQHVVLDVLGGVVLGALVAAIHLGLQGKRS
jgi:hypothetical protein